MLDSQRLAALPKWVVPAFATLTAAWLAVGIGAALGNPSLEGQLLIGVVLFALLCCTILMRPAVGYLVIVMSTIFMVCVAVTENRYLSPYDLVLPLAMAATLLGRTRADARAGDLRETGAGHDRIRDATRKFIRFGVIYFTLAFLSLGWMMVRIGHSEALESLMGLARGIEGAAVFPLALWWIRDEKRLWQTYHALIAGFLVLTAVNLVHFFMPEGMRAGCTFVINHLDWPLEGANECGYGMVVLWALILAKHQVRPKTHDFVLLGIVFFVLVLSQSRASLLAFVILNLFALRRVPLRFIIGSVFVFGIGLALAPHDFYIRLAHSLTLKRGSFEVYSAFIRVYGYITSVKIFMHNWLFGVGYLGGRFVSHEYNSLQVTNLGAENFLLETATGLGIFGLAIAATCFVRLWMLGPTVRDAVPKDSLAHHLGRLHGPLFAGLYFISLTGNTFVGNLSIAQNLLWCAILIRAGHIALNERAAAPAGA
jgi:hypothetical protein